MSGGPNIGKNCHMITSKTNKQNVRRHKKFNNKIPNQPHLSVEEEVKFLFKKENVPEFDEEKAKLIVQMIKEKRPFGQIKRATGYKPSQIKAIIQLFITRLSR